MVIIIAALTLGGLQLFGRGKAKPSEWFGKEEKTQSEQTSPETASYVSSALLSTNDNNLKTYSQNWTYNFATPKYQTWYNSAASTVKRWDYSVKGTFTCKKSDCTDSNVNYAPCIRLELEDYDDEDMPYTSESLSFDINGSSVKVRYYSVGNSTHEIGSAAITGINHTHSQSAALNDFSLSITESSLIIKIYSGSSDTVISSASFNKSSEPYQKYLSLLKSYSPKLRFGFESAVTEKQFTMKVTETMVLDSRTPVSLPADPTKEGHTFAGWYYGTQAEHGSSCRVYDGAPIYEDTALHAHFNINRYTVTYDVAGGTPIESEVLNWNTVASAPTPIRIGYNFKGWALADGSIYNNSPIKQNTTLTARWEIKIFTVTFYVDGDNGEEAYATLEVPYGSTLAEAMEEAEIISYKAMDISGLRVSKQSVITENTQVLVEELTSWEKYGDFVGRNKWFTWVIVGVIGALALTAAISITVAVKRK